MCSVSCTRRSELSNTSTVTNLNRISKFILSIYRYRYLSAEKLFFRRYRYRYRIVIFYHSLLNIGTVTIFVPVPYRYSMFKNDLLQREYGRLVSQMERPVLAK